jgi:2-polyprenyl-3-methyl-5-hydroxy-6-metoxy-1,4-benzoquinol methylase
MSTTPIAHMETASCPLCNASGITSHYYELPPYKAVQCSDCRLWYLSPRLREEIMRSMYENDSYFESRGDSGYSSYARQRENLKATFARFLHLLHQKSYTGGRLLEIGCGFGFLLEEAAPYFDYRAGTEYSAAAFQQLQNVCDKAYTGGIAEVPENEKFDLIITIGVIEHIYSPLAFNNRLREHLTHAGRLVHATPHMGSFWRKLMGRKWASFKVPEHVSYFDHHSLLRLFSSTGFSDMERLSFPHRFSLDLIGQKLGVKFGNTLGSLNLWLPATTIAMIASNKQPC